MRAFIIRFNRRYSLPNAILHDKRYSKPTSPLASLLPSPPSSPTPYISTQSILSTLPLPPNMLPPSPHRINDVMYSPLPITHTTPVLPFPPNTPLHIQGEGEGEGEDRSGQVSGEAIVHRSHYASLQPATLACILSFYLLPPLLLYLY